MNICGEHNSDIVYEGSSDCPVCSIVFDLAIEIESLTKDNEMLRDKIELLKEDIKDQFQRLGDRDGYHS